LHQSQPGSHGNAWPSYKWGTVFEPITAQLTWK
jgi:hypothetical protein